MGVLVESALQNVCSNSSFKSLDAGSFGCPAMKAFDTKHLDQRTEVQESLLGASLFVSRDGSSDSTNLCEHDALAVYDSFSVPSTPKPSLHCPSIAPQPLTSATSHFRDAFSTSPSSASVSERAMDLSLEALLDEVDGYDGHPTSLSDMYFTVPDTPVNVRWEQIRERFGDKPEILAGAHDGRLSDANLVAFESFSAPQNTSAPSATAQAFLDWAAPNPGPAPTVGAQKLVPLTSSAPCADAFADRAANHLLESLGSGPTSIPAPQHIHSSSSFDETLSALQVLDQCTTDTPGESWESLYSGSGCQCSGGSTVQWPMTY
jgi:hypothetical protein